MRRHAAEDASAVAAAAADAAPSPAVVDLEMERARRRGGWLAWGGIAASLVIGMAIGAKWLSPGSELDRAGNGDWMARGGLASALDAQMSGATSTNGTRIGLSFVARDGSYCRAFTQGAPGAAGSAGLACRENEGWRVRQLVAVAATDAASSSTTGSEGFRTAASPWPPAEGLAPSVRGRGRGLRRLQRRRLDRGLVLGLQHVVVAGHLGHGPGTRVLLRRARRVDQRRIARDDLVDAHDQIGIAAVHADEGRQLGRVGAQDLVQRLGRQRTRLGARHRQHLAQTLDVATLLQFGQTRLTGLLGGLGGVVLNPGRGQRRLDVGQRRRARRQVLGHMRRHQLVVAHVRGFGVRLPASTSPVNTASSSFCEASTPDASAEALRCTFAFWIASLNLSDTGFRPSFSYAVLLKSSEISEKRF
ncbi:hypothetical protein Ddc_20436 [Ditylenchus destructor]|nr:hypothetical protein Ddc_20436 [Ditylenchus destructor]